MHTAYFFYLGRVSSVDRDFGLDMWYLPEILSINVYPLGPSILSLIVPVGQVEEG